MKQRKKRTVNKQGILDSIAADYRAGRLGDDCIPAPGVPDRYGYGKVTVEGKFYTAHNYVLRQAVGPPPPDKPFAAHNCTTKACASPHHLEWKSQQENIADMDRDGTKAHGERIGNAKLDGDKVREILELRSTGYTYQALADMYGVGVPTVQDVVARRTWKHVTL